MCTYKATFMKIQNFWSEVMEETELEYYKRMREELPKYPTPLMVHAMAYVNAKIEKLEKESNNG